MHSYRTIHKALEMLGWNEKAKEIFSCKYYFPKYIYMKVNGEIFD